MRNTHLHRLGLVLLKAASATGSAACNGPASSDGASAGVESRWGFLNDASLTPDAPQFLVNKARGAKFRVCLPKYMADALPGIDSEVYAAVNVWASYVGRTIPVEIETKDLPRGRPDQSIDDLGAAYQTACGEGFDVVMGLGKLEGSAVGLTGASYSSRTNTGTSGASAISTRAAPTATRTTPRAIPSTRASWAHAEARSACS
jgi:hypothetical protein